MRNENNNRKFIFAILFQALFIKNFAYSAWYAGAREGIYVGSLLDLNWISEKLFPFILFYYFSQVQFALCFKFR